MSFIDASRQGPVPQDMHQQRRVWRFERIGWYVLLGLVALTLAGLFGNGPLSQRVVSSLDGQVICEFEGFSRNGSTSSLIIYARGKANSLVTLRLDGTFFEENSIVTLQPQPLVSRSIGRGFQLYLYTDADGLATVHLTMRNEGFGWFSAQAWVGPDSVARYQVVIYP